MSNIVDIESKDDFLNNTSDGRTVVKFWATWCGPCAKFQPHWERAASEVEDVKFLAVDVDKAPWAMQDYGVRSVPTVILFEDGAEVRHIKAPQGALPFINDIKG